MGTERYYTRCWYTIHILCYLPSTVQCVTYIEKLKAAYAPDVQVVNIQQTRILPGNCDRYSI